MWQIVSLLGFCLVYVLLCAPAGSIIHHRGLQKIVGYSRFIHSKLSSSKQGKAHIKTLILLLFDPPYRPPGLSRYAYEKSRDTMYTIKEIKPSNQGRGYQSKLARREAQIKPISSSPSRSTFLLCSRSYQKSRPQGINADIKASGRPLSLYVNKERILRHTIRENRYCHNSLDQ